MLEMSFAPMFTSAPMVVQKVPVSSPLITQKTPTTLSSNSMATTGTVGCSKFVRTALLVLVDSAVVVAASWAAVVVSVAVVALVAQADLEVVVASAVQADLQVVVDTAADLTVHRQEVQQLVAILPNLLLQIPSPTLLPLEESLATSFTFAT